MRAWPGASHEEDFSHPVRELPAQPSSAASLRPLAGQPGQQAGRPHGSAATPSGGGAASGLARRPDGPARSTAHHDTGPERRRRQRGAPPRGRQRGASREAAAGLAASVAMLPQPLQPAVVGAGADLLVDRGHEGHRRDLGHGGHLHIAAFCSGGPFQPVGRPPARDGQQHGDGAAPSLVAADGRRLGTGHGRRAARRAADARAGAR